MKSNIAVIGMGVMGSCLALNMANHNFKVAVYNYTPDLTEVFVKNHPHYRHGTSKNFKFQHWS